MSLATGRGEPRRRRALGLALRFRLPAPPPAPPTNRSESGSTPPVMERRPPSAPRGRPSWPPTRCRPAWGGSATRLAKKPACSAAEAGLWASRSSRGGSATSRWSADGGCACRRRGWRRASWSSAPGRAGCRPPTSSHAPGTTSAWWRPSIGWAACCVAASPKSGLPKRILDGEIAGILALGVHVETGKAIRRIEDVLSCVDGVVWAAGASTCIALVADRTLWRQPVHTDGRVRRTATVSIGRGARAAAALTDYLIGAGREAQGGGVREGAGGGDADPRNCASAGGSGQSTAIPLAGGGRPDVAEALRCILCGALGSLRPRR